MSAGRATKKDRAPALSHVRANSRHSDVMHRLAAVTPRSLRQSNYTHTPLPGVRYTHPINLNQSRQFASFRADRLKTANPSHGSPPLPHIATSTITETVMHSPHSDLHCSASRAYRWPREPRPGGRRGFRSARRSRRSSRTTAPRPALPDRPRCGAGALSPATAGAAAPPRDLTRPRR